MNKNILKDKLKRTGVAAVAIFALLSSFASPKRTVRAFAAGTDDMYNTKKIYQWEIAEDSKSLPAKGETCHIMVCWARYNDMYYISGNPGYADETNGIYSFSGTYMNNDRYLNSIMYRFEDWDEYDEDGVWVGWKAQVWSDSFYTVDTKHTWTMKVGDWESDYGGYYCNIYREDGQMLCVFQDGLTTPYMMFTGKDKPTWKYSGNESALFETYNFVLSLSDSNEGYSDWMWGGDCRLSLKRVNERDIFLHPEGNTVKVNCYDGGWDYGEADDVFKLYIGHEKDVMAIKSDFTVTTGNALQLKKDAYLDDDVVLTIEPGAVVTVDGEFFSNGIIKNYGTLVIYQNASLLYFDPKNASGSSLYNYGSDTTKFCSTVNETLKGEGNVIVMKNGRVVLQNTRYDQNNNLVGPVLQFTGGAALYNYGSVVAPFYSQFDGSHIMIAKGAAIISRTNLEKGLANLFEFEFSGYETKFGAKAVKGLDTDYFNIGKKANYIEYYGTWVRNAASDLKNKEYVDLKYVEDDGVYTEDDEEITETEEPCETGMPQQMQEKVTETAE